MEQVALHDRAWDEVVTELEYASETLSRSGQSGRAEDLRYIIDQINHQRSNGVDPEMADLARYEEIET